MRWWFAIAILSTVAAGCRAPAPTIDPFAPYGARVIPPPGTGAIGAPNGYYQPAPAGVPVGVPVAPGSTSMNPLQEVPPVANQPVSPRTSALPSPGNWESGGNGFGYAYPTYPTPNVTPASATVAASVLPPGAAPASYDAAFGYSSPPPVAIAEYNQPAPFVYPSIQQPLPIRPSSIQPSISGGTYIDNRCCPPVGDTVLVPQGNPYATASSAAYSITPASYGPVVTAQTTGWRRRRR